MEETRAGRRFGHVETLHGVGARQSRQSRGPTQKGPGMQQILRFPTRRRHVQASAHPPARLSPSERAPDPMAASRQREGANSFSDVVQRRTGLGVTPNRMNYRG